MDAQIIRKIRNMIIDKQLLDNLSAQAKVNPRLRMNKDMRTSADDQSQRMLNALELGTVLPIHRHTKSTETMVMIRGALKEYFYDNDGNLTDTIYLTAEHSIPSVPSVPSDPTKWCRMLQIPVGQWLSLEVLEEGTVIFEAKDGAYEPISDNDILKI